MPLKDDRINHDDALHMFVSLTVLVHAKTPPRHAYGEGHLEYVPRKSWGSDPRVAVYLRV